MPVRKIPRSYCHVTGVVASEKSSELIGYESRPERYFIKQVSFNPNVETCEEQPIRIPYFLKGGKSSHYTPDFLVHFKNELLPAHYWKPLLIEVKPRRRLFKDWETLHRKFLAAREFARKHEWEFTIITDKELITPYLKNVVFLTRYRKYTIDESDERLIFNAFENTINATPESLLQSISTDRDRIIQLIPALWKLIATFKIQVNLELPLNMHSPLMKTICEDDYERIYSLCAGRIGNARWRALRYYPFSWA
jgi:hypothetical protein